MIVSPYTDFLRNCLVIHKIKHLSPLSPLKNFHAFSTNLSMTNFPLPFPPFPPMSFPLLHLPFPSPLKNVNLPPLNQIISLFKATSSNSSIDTLPLPIQKQIINTVATPLHQIICGSLSSGSVPPDFKKAVINPILKKKHLYSLSTSNYRPISNLSIHSKNA